MEENILKEKTCTTLGICQVNGTVEAQGTYGTIFTMVYHNQLE